MTLTMRKTTKSNAPSTSVGVRVPHPLFPWQKEAKRKLEKPTTKRFYGRFGRRAGKTTFAVYWAGKFLSAENDRRAMWVAPTFDLTKVAFNSFLEMYDAKDQQGNRVCKKVRGRPEYEIELANGSTIIFRSADNPDGLKSRGFDLIVVDEADDVDDYAVQSGIEPSLMDRDGLLLAISTPFQTSGSKWFRRGFKQAERGEPGHEYVFGPSTENPSPAVAAEVERKRKDPFYPEELFKVEYLGMFPESGGAVFKNLKNITKDFNYLDGPRKQKDGRDYTYIHGIDVAMHQDFTVILTIELETSRVVHVQRFQTNLWKETSIAIIDYLNHWGGTAYMDSTGVGDVIYEEVVYAETKADVDGIVFTGAKVGGKADMVGKLKAVIENEEIELPNPNKHNEVRVLLDELENYGHRQTENGTNKYSAPKGGHDDTVIALVLAVWGMFLQTTPYLSV